MPTPTLTRQTSARHAARERRGRRRVGRSQAPTGPTASLLTFNISVAAEPRAGRILRWLRRRRDDVIVLSETNDGPGTRLLRAGLEGGGYKTFATVDGRERGVVIATLLPVRGTLGDVSVTLPCRAQGIVLDTSPQLAVLGVYVPSRDRSPEKVERKERFISSLLESIEALPGPLRRNLLLLGDYNAVARHHDPALPGFFPYEYDFHDELAHLGLGAAHEVKPYGAAHPHSWIGRTGIGYLYDYAHLGEGLEPRLQRCQYLHGPRQQRLSDHAALAVRIGIDAG
jgi:exodeoxyribonuclease-3